MTMPFIYVLLWRFDSVYILTSDAIFPFGIACCFCCWWCGSRTSANRAQLLTVIAHKRLLCHTNTFLLNVCHVIDSHITHCEKLYFASGRILIKKRNQLGKKWHWYGTKSTCEKLNGCIVRVSFYSVKTFLSLSVSLRIVSSFPSSLYSYVYLCVDNFSTDGDMDSVLLTFTKVVVQCEKNRNVCSEARAIILHLNIPYAQPTKHSVWKIEKCFLVYLH